MNVPGFLILNQWWTFSIFRRSHFCFLVYRIRSLRFLYKDTEWNLILVAFTLVLKGKITLVRESNFVWSNNFRFDPVPTPIYYCLIKDRLYSVNLISYVNYYIPKIHQVSRVITALWWHVSDKIVNYPSTVLLTRDVKLLRKEIKM